MPDCVCVCLSAGEYQHETEDCQGEPRASQTEPPRGPRPVSHDLLQGGRQVSYHLH